MSLNISPFLSLWIFKKVYGISIAWWNDKGKDFYFFMPHWSLDWQIIWNYHVALCRLSFIFFMFFWWVKCQILFSSCRFYSLHQKSAYVTPSITTNLSCICLNNYMIHSQFRFIDYTTLLQLWLYLLMSQL